MLLHDLSKDLKLDLRQIILLVFGIHQKEVDGIRSPREVINNARPAPFPFASARIAYPNLSEAAALLDESTFFGVCEQLIEKVSAAFIVKMSVNLSLEDIGLDEFQAQAPERSVLH